MQDRKYTTPDLVSEITSEDLAKMPDEYQIEVMKAWFYSKYEDPIDSCPYESKEGGYQFIWGGPYDAREELDEEFSDILTDKIITQLAEELESECWEWSRIPEYDYDDYYGVVSTNTEFHVTFTDGLRNVRELLEADIDEDLKRTHYRLLFVNVITVLETFLSDAFINTVIANETLLRKFVETNKEFASHKFSMSKIFSCFENIEKEARNRLLNIVWHNLDRVKPMYKTTLDIEFPEATESIFSAIDKRHHIVHRNGKDKNGNEVEVTKGDISSLLDDVSDFVNYIDSQFAM